MISDDEDDIIAPSHQPEIVELDDSDVASSVALSNSRNKRGRMPVVLSSDDESSDEDDEHGGAPTFRAAAFSPIDGSAVGDESQYGGDGESEATSSTHESETDSRVPRNRDYHFDPDESDLYDDDDLDEGDDAETINGCDDDAWG